MSAFESDVEDDETMEPSQYECSSDEEWVPDADEASDIKLEAVVELDDEEKEDEDLELQDEELELPGEVSVIAGEYVAKNKTEWYSQELPRALTPSHNVLRTKGGL